MARPLGAWHGENHGLRVSRYRNQISARFVPRRTTVRTHMSGQERTRLPAGARGSEEGGRGQATGWGTGCGFALPVPSFRLRVWAWGRGGATARRDFQTRTMAMRWWCWRRACSWRPVAVGSPRPERPGCAEPLGTRAASDTRAQVRPGRARCPRRRGHCANDSRRPNEWEDAHVRRGSQSPLGRTPGKWD